MHQVEHGENRGREAVFGKTARSDNQGRGAWREPPLKTKVYRIWQFENGEADGVPATPTERKAVADVLGVKISDIAEFCDEDVRASA